MKIFLMFLLLFFASTQVSNADSYFRAGSGVSFFQDMELTQFDEDLGIQSDERGFNLNGALGYKPHQKGKSGFFGEIESGYADGDGDFTYTSDRWESPSQEVEVEMQFVHLFFNVGYEHVLQSAIGANDPIKLAVYAGAGPVFSEISANNQPGKRRGFRFADNEGDTALGWQAGATLWVPLLTDVEFGLGGKWVNRGEHIARRGFKYRNDSVDATGNLRFLF